MATRRIILGSLLFALMLFELCVRSYFTFVHIGSSDGWVTTQLRKGGAAVVTQILPDGPATDLKVGDIFIAINGITRAQNSNIANYAQTVPPGTSYLMTVSRDGIELTFTFKTIAIQRFGLEAKIWIIVGFLFLIVGYGILLLKPENKQVWLLSLTLFTFPILPDWNFPIFIISNWAGEWVTYAYSLAKILALFFVVFFARLFLYFPENSVVLRRFPYINKYLSLPFYLFIFSLWGMLKLPAPLRDAYFELVPFLRNNWFTYISMPAFILYIVATIVFMVINYKSSDKVNRERLRTVITGTGFCATFFLVFIIFDFFRLSATWPSLSEWVSVGFALSTPLIPVTFTYAIIRHKVIPISIIVRRGVRYFLVSKGAAALVIAIIFVIMFFVMKLGYRYFDIANIQWVSAISGITAIIVWNGAYNFYQRKIAPIIDRRFFRESYDAREILSGLQRSIMTVTDGEKLMLSVARAVQRALHSDSVSFFILDEKSKLYKKSLAIRHNSGLQNFSANGSAIPSSSFVLKYLSTYGELDVEEFYPASGSDLNSERASDNEQTIAKILIEEKSSLLIPIKFRSRTSGVMSLGTRLGDLPYSREDRQMLKSIAGQMATLLENIRLKDIEAQNEIRAKELEGARKLQLSLLPKKLPQLPGLEIAAYMKTAAEVGGDYYDFHTDCSGLLTVVVGDATGHGLKAGTMVTAAKSFFEAFADRTDISQILGQSSTAIKRMNLRSMFMAMTMLKIRGGQISIGNAGMPPIMIYRGANKAVEEITLTGLPLGGPTNNYIYRTVNAMANSGDVVLIMSDGLAERFDPRNRMLDYMEIKKSFASCGDQSPQIIINKLVSLGNAWGGTRPQDDDITFVAIKFI